MKEAFLEVQNDASDGACYNTFDFNPDAKKYGFLCINTTYGNCFCHMAFDSPEAWADLTGCDEREATYLTELRVGAAMESEGGRYIRLW